MDCECTMLARIHVEGVAGREQCGFDVAHHLGFAGGRGVVVTDLLILALNHFRRLSGSHVEFVGVVIKASATGDDAAGKAAEESRVGAAFGILSLRTANRQQKR